MTRALLQRALDALECAGRIGWRGDEEVFIPSKYPEQLIDDIRAELKKPENLEIRWGIDRGTRGDRTCVSIIKMREDGVREVIDTQYSPYPNKS